MWRLFYERGPLLQAPIRADATDAKSVVEDSGTWRLHWDTLVGPDGPLAVSVQITVQQQNGEWIWTANLDNRDEKAIVKEFQFPLLGGALVDNRSLITTEVGGLRQTDFAGYVERGSRFRSVPYADADHEGIQTQLLYPSVSAGSNCFTLAGEGDGWYFGCHDGAFSTTVHLFRLDGPRRDRPEVGFGRHLRLESGQSQHFENFITRPYSGTWHVAADRYRQWANTWFKPRLKPAWLRNMTGWQRLIFRHQNGEVLSRFDDLSRIQADGEEAGLDGLFMFGWWPGGHDRGYPHYEPAPELGGADSLAAAVEAFQREGCGHVICYTSGRLIDRDSDFYRNVGQALTVKRRSGAEVGDAYLFSNAATYERLHGSIELTPACLPLPDWTAVLHRQVDQAADLGFRAVFFDQLGTLEHPCHDASHGHPVPYFHQAADKRRVLDALQQHARQRRPDMAVGLELFTDCTAQLVDFVHGLYQQNDMASPGYRERREKPRTTGFIEWTRYTFPEVTLTDRDIRDDTDVLRRANLVVLRGLVSDVEVYRCRRTVAELPAYQAHLGQLNALRRRHADVLLRGRYRDTVGIRCDNPELEARRFIGDQREAVVITQSHLPEVTATVTLGDRLASSHDGVGQYGVKKDRVVIGQDAVVVLLFDKDQTP